jgi:hypothetical protein
LGDSENCPLTALSASEDTYREHALSKASLRVGCSEEAKKWETEFRIRIVPILDVKKVEALAESRNIPIMT